METFLKVISLRIFKNSIKCSSLYRHFFISSFYIISLIVRNLHYLQEIFFSVHGRSFGGNFDTKCHLDVLQGGWNLKSFT